MPELPEVETICRGLKQILLSPLLSPVRMTGVELRCGDLRQKIQKESFFPLIGEDLLGIRRRAKYILFDFRQHILVNHLGMTGSWRPMKADDRRKHDHCVLYFLTGASIVFHDPRRFGLLLVIKKSEETVHPVLKLLGPEPLTSSFNSKLVFQETRGRSKSIKSWLMDQRQVVGVGNIYACEALFHAGVKPMRQAGQITQSEAATIVKAIKAILTAAIKKGGTTFRDFRQTADKPGAFQHRLQVYDRKGKPCRRCQHPIRHQILAGRSTFWCPSCQD